MKHQESVENITTFRIERQHLRPIVIDNKEEYYYGISEIEINLTGLIDSWFANTFLRESCLLLRNSIQLLESGYFDCAFYSLRQSIEIATTMCYLAEIDSTSKSQEFEKWEGEQKFKGHVQMEGVLKKFEKNYHELDSVFTVKFEAIKKVQEKLNKYVHKQGYDKSIHA